MKNSRTILSLSTLLPVLLIVACGLVSGTFVIPLFFSDIDFTTESGLYHFDVDLSENEDWEEHEDDIESIDALGFELWITNHESTAATFSIYLDSLTVAPYETEAELTTAGVHEILTGLTISPGVTAVSYSESLGYLTNVDYLSTQVLTGMFRCYGVSSFGTTSGYTIDSVRVIVTATAAL